MDAVVGEECLEALDFFAEGWDFLSESCEFCVLLLAIAGAGGVHAFFDAAFFYEFFFHAEQGLVEHRVGLVAEG